jgi:hypothetical protein
VVTAQNASLGGAVKTAIEQAGLGLAAYRDRPPARAHLPYCVVLESVGDVVLPHGDTDDPNRDDAHRQELQVDLWQAKRDPATGANTEQYDLPQRLVFTLHGSRFPTSPVAVAGARVTGTTRLTDPDANLIHHIVSLVVDHRNPVSAERATSPVPPLADRVEMVPADCVVAVPNTASWAVVPSEGSGAYPWANVWFRVYDYVGPEGEEPDGTTDLADSDIESLDWGDGTVVTAPYVRAPRPPFYGDWFKHAYATSGTFVITAHLTADWAADLSVSYPINIDYYMGKTPNPPNLLVGQVFGIWPIDGYQGPPLPPDEHFNWISWGDGSPVETPPYVVDGNGHATHVYSAAGSFRTEAEYANGDSVFVTATVATVVGTQAELDALNAASVPDG